MATVQLRNVAAIYYPGHWLDPEEVPEVGTPEYAALAGESYLKACSVLENLHVKAVISPLHDKDTYTRLDWEARGALAAYNLMAGNMVTEEKTRQDGAISKQEPGSVLGMLKKPHWHIMLTMEAKQSLNQFSDMLRPLGIRYVSPVKSVYSYTRYLCHLDSDDKAKYPLWDVRTFGGFNASPLEDESDVGALRELPEVLAVIDHYKVTTFKELADLAMVTRDMRLLRTLTKKCSYWRSYFGNARVESDNPLWRSVMDGETEEETAYYLAYLEMPPADSGLHLVA